MITEYQSHPSKVWGLNHSQKMNGNQGEITGGFDPQQELWISKETPRKKGFTHSDYATTYVQGGDTELDPDNP